MATDSGSSSTVDFVAEVKRRAEVKVAEYYQLLHEQRRTELRLESIKKYIGHLNNFLAGEDEQPVILKEIPKGSPVGKPGNRAKDFPLRKPEFEGMTLDEIIKTILDKSPNEIYHGDVIAYKIYEIQSKSDLIKVRRSLVSTLRRGAKKGLWEFVPRNKYKGKVVVEQGRLVRT